MSKASRISITAPVRRGLTRALIALQADIEVLRAEYREHGMSERDLDDYEQAVEWIWQQSKS